MDRKTPAFKKLQKYWYKKLADSGFEDIEDTDNDTLKRFSLALARSKSSRPCPNNERYEREMTRYRANQEFYTLCRHFLHSPEFETLVAKRPKYRKAWEMYCEGTILQVIADEIKMHRCSVRYIVRKLTHAMKKAAKNDGSHSD